MSDDAFELQPGRVMAFINPKADPSRNQPTFSGSLKLPDDYEARVVTLWTKSGPNGQVIFTGTLNPSPRTQIGLSITGRKHVSDPVEIPQANGDPLTLNPDTLVMFTNTSKTSATPTRPDYWGYLHVDGGAAPLRVSVWVKTDRNGRAYLSGSLSQGDGRDRQRDDDGR